LCCLTVGDAVLRLFAVAFIWGWSFLLIKVQLGGAPPEFIAFSRAVLGALVLVVLLRFSGDRVVPPRRQWGHVAVLGVVSSALPFTLIAWGEEHITSALASVLNAATPLAAAFFAAVMLRERLRLPQIAGLLLGVTGVGIVAGIGGSDIATSSIAGTLAVVAAAVSYGVAFPYSRRFMTGLTAPQMAVAPLITAAGLLAAPAVVQSVDHGLQPTPTRVVAMILLGCVGTGIGLMLNYRSILVLGPTTASLVTYLIPLVGVTVGITVLGEPFSVRQLVGGLTIIFSVALVQGRLFGPRQAADEPVPEAEKLPAR
jgi:drug/metabolite transporter (DMT)-like permease